MRQGDVVLEARGVVRRYPLGERTVTAVDGIDLEVRAGELLAITGPSGCGKSTLLHMLGGIDRPDEGAVLVEGRDYAAMSDVELALLRRRRVAFILQFFNLLSTMNALDNVAFPLLLDGARDATDRARAALDRVGMLHRAGHRPSELSGGEQQRVAVARALVVGPAAILADEPTGNLDSESGLQVIELLREVVDDGHTIVLVTHDERWIQYADRHVELLDGQVLSGAAVNPA